MIIGQSQLLKFGDSIQIRNHLDVFEREVEVGEIIQRELVLLVDLVFLVVLDDVSSYHMVVYELRRLQVPIVSFHLHVVSECLCVVFHFNYNLNPQRLNL